MQLSWEAMPIKQNQESLLYRDDCGKNIQESGDMYVWGEDLGNKMEDFSRW